LLFVLLSNGRLEILLNDVVFVTDRLTLSQESFIVHDFSLVLTSILEVKLWVIYGNGESSGDQNFIGIFGGPSFLTEEFTAKIPKSLDQAGTMHTNLTYLFPSKVTPYEEPFAFLELSSTGTKVYHMIETSTDATIQKLLSREKFDQAAALAIQYNKDLDVVYKAKARSKFNELLAYRNSKQISERTGKYFSQEIVPYPCLEPK
jgi:hypothetical protein